MADSPDETVHAPVKKPKLVKVVDRDQSAEDERDHFRKQLVRRPWTH